MLLTCLLLKQVRLDADIKEQQHQQQVQQQHAPQEEDAYMEEADYEGDGCVALSR